jgi:phosphoserine phosphatase RsbU/P
MAHSDTVIPRLQDIAKVMPETASHTKISLVVDIFKNDSTILALPIADQGSFQGVITRKALFFQHLARPFAMEIFGKKPIRELMDEQPVAMAPELDVTTALAQLLAEDAHLQIDAFPLVDRGECLGIVSVSDLMMKISESQSALLEALKSMSARIRDEVMKASEVQQDLLPAAEYRFGPVTVSAGIRTSSEIGGDFYDYFELEDGRLGLVVADVSGHGVQSGMVTTAAKASLHTLIGQGITTPAVLLHYMNNAILATARQTLLMTCLIAIIDLQRQEVVMANAGHNFPYLIEGETGRAIRISTAPGFPLGFEQDCLYEELSTPFSPGDTLFLYTDGIVECVNSRNEEFGYERLEAFLSEHAVSRPIDLKQNLLETAIRFMGERSFEDDVTLLVASCRGDNSL